MYQARIRPEEKYRVVAKINDAIISDADRGSLFDAIAGAIRNVLSFDLAGGSRVIVRPSGTEPKIKIYLDVREPMTADESFADAKSRAKARMDELLGAVAALAGLD